MPSRPPIRLTLPLPYLYLDLSRPSSQCEGHFIKNNKIYKNARISKKSKLEKWKIDFLEISNFSKKMKKGNERKITKSQKMGGARFARVPHFLIFWIFLALPFFNFLEKLENSRIFVFPFFHFCDFFEICLFLLIFLGFGSRISGWST